MFSELLAPVCWRRPLFADGTELCSFAGISAGGAAVGSGQGVQVHALRLPSYILSCEALFGLPDERLTIRHDAGSSAAPYVAGTLLAIRKVQEINGLMRGLDALIE